MKSIKRNYIYNLLDNVITILSPVIIAPYISRVIGASGVGRISFAESVMTMFLIGAGFGISIYGEREVSYVQDDLHKRSVAFWNAFLLKAVIVPVFLVAYLLYCSKTDDIIARYLSLHIVAEVFAINWFFMGIEEFGFLVIRSIVIRVLQIIYIFVFVKSPGDVVTYAMASVYVVILTNISSMLYLPRHLGKVSIRELSPLKGFVPSLMLFLPTVASLIYSVLDKSMLGWIGQDSFENGYYEQAYNISHIVLTIITSISTVMIPRIGLLFKKQKKDDLNEMMYTGFRYVFMLGLPLTFGLACVAGNFVPWFFGNGWDPVINLLILFSPICLIVGLSNMTGRQYLVSTKRENLHTRSVFIGAGVNLVLNFFLIPRWKAVGAAAASVIAECVVLVLDFYAVRKDLKLGKILKCSLNYLFAALAMTATLIVEIHLFDSSILNTFILVISGMVVYFMTLVVVEDDLFISDFYSVIGPILGR